MVLKQRGKVLGITLVIGLSITGLALVWLAGSTGQDWPWVMVSWGIVIPLIIFFRLKSGDFWGSTEEPAYRHKPVFNRAKIVMIIAFALAVGFMLLMLLNLYMVSPASFGLKIEGKTLWMILLPFFVMVVGILWSLYHERA